MNVANPDLGISKKQRERATFRQKCEGGRRRFVVNQTYIDIGVALTNDLDPCEKEREMSRTSCIS